MEQQNLSLPDVPVLDNSVADGIAAERGLDTKKYEGKSSRVVVEPPVPVAIKKSTRVGGKIAKILLDTESVLLRPDAPFTLTSGKKSPVYVDCRRLIAFPKERQQIMKLAHEKLEKQIGHNMIDVIAGGETAGIAYAAWLADSMNKPMAYIRKKPKGFGKNARIEGNIKQNDNVLLVEDLASDGGSKLSFVDAIRQNNATCQHCFVIFYYGIFSSADKLLHDANITLHYLATWHDIINIARSNQMLPTKSLNQVQEFIDNPEQWQEKNQ